MFFLEYTSPDNPSHWKAMKDQGHPVLKIVKEALVKMMAKHFSVLKGHFKQWITAERKARLWRDVAGVFVVSMLVATICHMHTYSLNLRRQLVIQCISMLFFIFVLNFYLISFFYYRAVNAVGGHNRSVEKIKERQKHLFSETRTRVGYLVCIVIY